MNVGLYREGPLPRFIIPPNNFDWIPAFLDRDPCTTTTGKADIPSHAFVFFFLPDFPFFVYSSISAKFVATTTKAISSWIGRMAI